MHVSTLEKSPGVRTHEVTNQPPPLVDYNVFEADRVMVEAVKREGADWAVDRISAVGEVAGRVDVIELGRLANENPPKLRTHDRYGNRIDIPEFHPAWHDLMRLGISHELHSLPWREPQHGAHVARAAAFMCFSQAEAGVGCPISMTYSVVPALRKQPELAEDEERVALGGGEEPLVAGDLVLGPGAAAVDRSADRGIGPHVGAALLLTGDDLPRVVAIGEEARLPFGGQLRLVAQRRDRRVGHRDRAADAGLRLGEAHEGGRSRHVGAGSRLAPGKRVQPVIDPQPHQLVP